ncbi:uncharacterized protein LOC122395907 [Colletes gigas]|uniref:uncharacterized protein LOC122395907 n=1 Tax=Colletes gigas TaxID=935657 RepID=UPI001C9A4D66|nr:uncharacterized protein LOC122395907 [Colletes gigas]
MHYPLHITVLCAGLWILRGDAHAAKTGVSPEVLTSFAKNVASVLSSTLLSDFQDSPSNQSSTNLGSPKKPPETQSNKESIETASPSAAGKPPGRLRRFVGGPRTSNEGRNRFQNAYVTSNVPQFLNRYSQEPIKPYEFAVNRDLRVPQNGNNKNVNADARDNSIDAEINAASLRYSNPQFKYKPELVDSLANANQYGHFGFPNYNHLHQTPGTAQSLNANGIDANGGANENAQPTQITHRPYNLNYHGPFHGPHHPPFYRHPDFYPNHGPVEGNGQPAAPETEQVDGNPSRITEDQNQGQSTIGGYDYPRFYYRPPYHGGFYGPPYFYNHPYNGSFDPALEQPGGNNTHGHFPHGFPGYGFNPYGPYQPYYPNFHGYGRPAQPQNPPENAGNAEQLENGQNGQNGNSSANQPPYGYPPYGPFYGDVHFPGYPLGPIIPHRFHHGFHDHFIHRFKLGPYLPPELYGYFAPGPWFQPFGGHNNKNNGNKPAMMPEDAAKPAEAEKTINASPENSGMGMNSDAEVISESKSEGIETLPSNGHKKFLFPWSLAKDKDKLTRQEFNVLAENRDSED